MSEATRPASAPTESETLELRPSAPENANSPGPAAELALKRSTYLPEENETYRPVSGWAVAGVLLSLFSIFCWMESPPLFPSRAWWIPGLLLSAWAWRKIAQAPQVFAGLTVAKLGVAISLINGLGAITAQEVTYWVVRAEALRFADELLTYIDQGKERELFLATLEPEVRRHKEPPADRKGLERYFESQSRLGNPVVGFRNSHLGKLMLEYAPKRKYWQYRGVSSYEVLSDVSRPGYRFRLRYLVTSERTDEQGQNITFDVQLSLVCQRIRDTRSRWKTRREWFLENWP
ncbi:MAG: hypothetical protein RMI91_06210 [Gemmatales bacterium]|nr:hypothetical protein [Gemmatales bacterium]MDW7994229.1 hypothetical protein [Gemmatales bacterium]